VIINDELIYEPRALWDVQEGIPTTDDGERVITFDRENFRNGTRNPITLTKLLLSPVGYTFKSFGGVNANPVTLGDWDACATAIQKCKLFLKAPQRQAYTRRPRRIPLWNGAPTADISMVNDATLGYSAGLLNTVKWDFDKPLVIPKGGIAEMAVGCPLYAPAFGGPTPSRQTVTISFFEAFGLPGGNARTHETTLGFYSGTAATHPLSMADGLQSGTGTDADIYPPNQILTRDIWRAQQSTQVGSTRVTGLSVSIDQLQYEDEIQTAGAPYAGVPMTNLAARTPVGTTRLFGCGSGQEWWRENIPLALLGATLGPALVFALKRPITLHPGDTLDAELTFPGGPDSNAVFPHYKVGMSFTGYAAIEG